MSCLMRVNPYYCPYCGKEITPITDPDEHFVTSAKVFSLREPDTPEKAMQRFRDILEDKDGLDYETEDKLWSVYNRLTALIERGA